MLPLGGQDFPKHTEELETALCDGLSVFGAPNLTVEVRGEWPALQRIAIDLSGAQVPKAAPRMDGEKQGSLEAREVELIASALRYENASMDVQLRARDVQLSFVRGPQNQRMLAITGAAHGEVTIAMKKSDLELLVGLIAARAARPHGVGIAGTTLSLTAAGPRAVNFTGEILAQKMFMKTVLRLTGRLEIEENLTATLSGLHCSGAGLMGTLACNFLQPYLREFESKPLLAALDLSGLRLADAALDAGGPLRLTARLAAATC